MHWLVLVFAVFFTLFPVAFILYVNIGSIIYEILLTSKKELNVYNRVNCQG
jgi:hypothetical protein